MHKRIDRSHYFISTNLKVSPIKLALVILATTTDYKFDIECIIIFSFSFLHLTGLFWIDKYVEYML